MVFGCGIEEPSLAAFIIVVFALASAVIPLAAVAIWRSASNYPRRAWWQTPVAWGAKFCAVFSGLVAVLSLAAGLYLLSDYIRAALARE